MMSDITVPPRRRRRPTLSCVECRRRKIKCDRHHPCGHCVQVKVLECIYPETHPVINRHKSLKYSSALFPVNNIGSPGVSPPASLVSSVPSSVHNPTTRNISSLENESNSGGWSLPSTPGSPASDCPFETNVQTLINRTRSLESLPPSLVSNSTSTKEVMSVLGVNLSSFGDVTLQVGGNHSAPPTHSAMAQEKPLNPERTQFFGRSHWMNTFDTFTQKCVFKTQNGKFITGMESQEVREILADCRSVIKRAKIQSRKTSLHTSFKDQIPPRNIADKLVNLYFRTCESTYRILHIPSFMKEYNEYWVNPESLNTTLIVRILLVMAIGACFYQGDGEAELRNEAQQWVELAQSWAARPINGKQLTIPWIQIYCLLLLSQQTNALRVELVWISAGNLLRTAFSMGLHRDPKYFPKLSIFLTEIRRRIWATVLEMVVQTSMDVGMPPLIMSRDFDTEPPSNIDDEDISATMTTMSNPKPRSVYTRTSVQITLVKSLRTRLEIVQYINGFHSVNSYEQALRFSQDITKACNEASKLIHSYPIHHPRPTALEINLLDILVRRFLLEIHRSFFIQAQTDPRYYFSRKVCLETALKIFSYSGTNDLSFDHNSHAIDDYERLKIVGEGLIKPIFFHAITIVVVELLLQLEEDAASGIPPSARTKSAREPLYHAINAMVKLTTDRVKAGENNAMGLVSVSGAAALIKALSEGLSPDEIVPKAVKQSALLGLEMLSARLKVDPLPRTENQSVDHPSRGGGSMGDVDLDFDLSTTDLDMDFGMDENWGLNLQDSWIFTDCDGN